MNARGRTLLGLMAGMSVCIGGGGAAADNTDVTEIVDSKIESIGLFKNGLAVVRRRVVLPGPGIYDVLDLPEPVHGTFRVESRAELTIRMTEVDVPLSASDATAGFDAAALAGSVVTVHFKQPHLPSLTGRVVAPRPKSNDAVSRHELWSAPRSPWAWSGNWAPRPVGPAASIDALVLETEQGEAVIDRGMIAFVMIEERGPIETTARRPVMRLSVTDAALEGPIDVGILYLTKGISWAPSYVIDLTESSRLQLTQKAVIKNELADFEDAELLLISGYPGVEFGDVLSPRSPATSLSTFFAALGRESRLSHAARADVLAQSVMTNTIGRTSGGVVEEPVEKGIDLKYESVGRHSMSRGDAMLLTTARTETPYDRIVQWFVPEQRDEYGHVPGRSASQVDADANSAWDAIRFSNPLERSLTTGPALVVEGDLALGQQTLYWASPGEEIVLPINRSLTVRTRAREVEREGAREAIAIADTRYHRTTIDGMLEVANHRDEAVEMVVRRAFRGTLLSADDEPEAVMPAESDWSINPRRKLTWTIRLAPGERRRLTYEYQVLVRR